jgi:hypothetical protein
MVTLTSFKSWTFFLIVIMAGEVGGSVTVDSVVSSTLTVNMSTTQLTITMLPDYDLGCDYIDTSYTIVGSIICFMCFMFGVLYTFFGELSFLF